MKLCIRNRPKQLQKLAYYVQELYRGKGVSPLVH